MAQPTHGRGRRAGHHRCDSRRQFAVALSLCLVAGFITLLDVSIVNGHGTSIDTTSPYSTDLNSADWLRAGHTMGRRLLPPAVTSVVTATRIRPSGEDRLDLVEEVGLGSGVVVIVGLADVRLR